MSHRIRRTKIVVTLGPATDHPDQITQIISAGANVLRLNFSHGEAKEHIRRAHQARTIAAQLHQHIALLGDLQGPKIRTSTFEKGAIDLKVGASFILDAQLPPRAGTEERVGIDYKNLPQDLIAGDKLLLDDGRIQLQVNRVEGAQIFTTVLVGGTLSNNKGINKIGGGLSAAALTEKDKADVALAAEIGVDYLAISFPRSKEDLHYARYLAHHAGSRAKIVAKIERAEAVADERTIDEIILAADAIMVARGDLGVEIGDAELVGMQKKLIRRASSLNRIVITATQMMESMIHQPLPTRAEVMDVANAVLDGTDAVMLSAETATGHYPVATVTAMANICLGAEKVAPSQLTYEHTKRSYDSIEQAIAMSAIQAAHHLRGVAAIIAMTESGRTVLIMSRMNAGLPIFAMSRHPETLNLTALYQGVTPIYFESGNDGFIATQNAIVLLKEQGYLQQGNLVIVTQGDVMRTIGSTNTCRILRVT